MNKLTIERDSPTTAIVKRRFDASPEKVFDAHTQPELIGQWMLGPDGWSMTICVSDPVPGGRIHYQWTRVDSGESFDLTGEYEVLERPHRIVHTERMHLPDATPSNHIVTTFEPVDSGTLMTMRMSLPDAESLEAMLATGMADGMEFGFKRLDDML